MSLAQKYGSERLGYLFAILAAIMFGSVSTLAKPLVSTVNPLLLSSMIYLIAAVTLTPLAHKQPFPANKKNCLLILLLLLEKGAPFRMEERLQKK